MVRRSRLGAEKITAEDERIRTTRNVNRTTEISADWSSVNDIYESALKRILAEIPDITMLGGHSSHSYINGTNMYFNYFYDLIDCAPEEEADEVLLADHLDHLRGNARVRRLDRPPPRDRQGAGPMGQGGVRLVVPDARDAEAGLRPERHHEQGNDHSCTSRLTGRNCSNNVGRATPASPFPDRPGSQPRCRGCCVRARRGGRRASWRHHAATSSQNAVPRSGIAQVRTISCTGRTLARGTGFLIGTSVVMTTRRILSGACTTVVTVNGRSIAAKNWATLAATGVKEAATDLATIKLVRAAPGAHVFAVRGTGPAVGTSVTVAGYPAGSELVVRQGKLTWRGTKAGAPLIAAKFAGAKSADGAPLLDGTGRVTGIVQAGRAARDVPGSRDRRARGLRSQPLVGWRERGHLSDVQGRRHPQLHEHTLGVHTGAYPHTRADPGAIARPRDRADPGAGSDTAAAAGSDGLRRRLLLAAVHGGLMGERRPRKQPRRSRPPTCSRRGPATTGRSCS